MKPPIAADPCGGNETLSATAGKRRVRSSIIPCTRSDHVALENFLAEIFGSSYPAEFQASLADPLYAPADRLLLRRMGRMIAHVHVTHRIMQFGSLALPVAGLQGLATAANCRRQGLGTHLLLAAERQMARSGALVGLPADPHPAFLSPYRLGLVRRQFGGCAASSACRARPTLGTRPRPAPRRANPGSSLAAVGRRRHRPRLSPEPARQLRPAGAQPRLLALASGTQGLRPVLCGPGRPRPLGLQGKQHAASSATRPSRARKSSNS